MYIYTVIAENKNFPLEQIASLSKSFNKAKSAYAYADKFVKENFAEEKAYDDFGFEVCVKDGFCDYVTDLSEWSLKILKTYLKVEGKKDPKKSKGKRG